MIRQADRQPFVVCMDDGAAYKITHPDFALLAHDTLIVAASPDDGLGGKGFVICLLPHISRLELIKKKARAK